MLELRTVNTKQHSPFHNFIFKNILINYVYFFNIPEKLKDIWVFNVTNTEKTPGRDANKGPYCCKATLISAMSACRLVTHLVSR